MLLPAPHAHARVHPVFNSTPLMDRWDSGRLDLDQLDNPEPSRADRERLLWSQNGLCIEFPHRFQKFELVYTIKLCHN